MTSIAGQGQLALSAPCCKTLQHHQLRIRQVSTPLPLLRVEERQQLVWNKQKLVFGCCEIYRGSPYQLLSSCFHLQLVRKEILYSAGRSYQCVSDGLNNGNERNQLCTSVAYHLIKTLVRKFYIASFSVGITISPYRKLHNYQLFFTYGIVILSKKATQTPYCKSTPLRQANKSGSCLQKFHGFCRLQEVLSHCDKMRGKSIFNLLQHLF